MRNKIVIICLILAMGVLTACGSKKAGKKEDMKLSKEFTLEYKEVKDSTALENIFFANEVTKAKVSALSADKRGASLDYSLDQTETEKLINLFQKEEIKAVETDQAKYNSTAQRDSYGYIVEFVDSLDRFYPGASRMTCFTTIDENYLSIIDDNGDTKMYKIELPENIIAFLNKASEENYKGSKGRTGWFDKVFNSK